MASSPRKSKKPPAALSIKTTGPEASGVQSLPKRNKPPAAPKRPEEISENCLQKHSNQWLRKTYPALLAFHVPNERIGGIGAIMHFKAMGVLDGVADWLLFPRNGRRLAIELKKEGEKAREGQERFERAWQAAGGEYFLVDGLEEFKTVVNACLLFG